MDEMLSRLFRWPMPAAKGLAMMPGDTCKEEWAEGGHPTGTVPGFSLLPSSSQGHAGTTGAHIPPGQPEVAPEVAPGQPEVAPHWDTVPSPARWQ